MPCSSHSTRASTVDVLARCKRFLPDAATHALEPTRSNGSRVVGVPRERARVRESQSDASYRQGAKAGAPGRPGVCAEGASRLLPCWTSNAVPKVWMLLGLATPSTYHHSHTARSRVTSSSM